MGQTNTFLSRIKNRIKVPEVSVIICTRNRSQKLLNCLDAIYKNSFKNFEVIVIDQSDDRETYELTKKTVVRYFKCPHRGLGYARNQGIKQSKSDVVVFTDDDCIPTPGWLNEIAETFRISKQVSGSFGRTVAYQPKKHRGYFCPCTFNKSTRNLITRPGKHSKNIGFGNNMAFRKNVFMELGGFKEWLGSGSIGESAEDAEMALRILISGKKLLYNPKMLVAHDKWMTRPEMERQYLSYLVGEIACYGYFARLGHNFAKAVIKDNFRKSFKKEPKQIFLSLIRLKRSTSSLLFWWIRQLLAKTKGLLVAIFFGESRYLVIYSNRFPITEPPRYYLDFAKEISYKVPMIVLDLFGSGIPLTGIRAAFYKLESILNIFTFRRFCISSVHSRILKYSFLARIFLYRMIGFKIALIKNFPEDHGIDPYIHADITAFDCTDHYYHDEFTGNRSQLRRFDIVFVNYDSMHSLLKKYNRNVVKVPTGYIRDTSIRTHRKTPRSVVFVGGISRRLEFTILKYCIKNLPDFRFYFIGEIYLNKYYLEHNNRDSEKLALWNEICSLPNVTYLGETTVAGVLTQLDRYEVGIIPYDTTDYMNGYSNPMKLYEYLLCGLPVVSTPILAVKENSKKYPVFIASGAKEFSDKIRTASKMKTIPVDKKSLLKENHMEYKVRSVLHYIEQMIQK